ncbi:hypothetical protein [Streptomyces sp. NPDC048560]
MTTRVLAPRLAAPRVMDPVPRTPATAAHAGRHPSVPRTFRSFRTEEHRP